MDDPTAPAVTPLQLHGRTVLVCGARFAGASAARVLLSRGARVLLTDDARPAGVDELVAAGAEFLGAVDVVPDGVSLVVTSPGFRPSSPVLVHAAQTQIEVLGEVEFAWRLRGPNAATWLAITGTNGKTTTVRMLESILRAAGLRALAVGNVGVSIIDAVTSDQHLDVLAVELSSYQLHWSSTLRPAAAAVLNLAPDHLDWHITMDEYSEAKAKIWNTPIAIGNADDPLVSRLLDAKLLRRPATRGVTVTLAEPALGQLGVRGGVLVDRAFTDGPGSGIGGGSGSGIDLIAADEIRPVGAHNVANALAAAALARAYGVTSEAVAEGLRSFVPDPHRNQLVGTRGGVRYVDDSKATNPHAAAASLAAYERVVWIAGGQLKDAPVDELVAEFAPRLRAVVLLGADRAVIAAALLRHAPDVPVFTVASTDDGAMIEVVRAATAAAKAGDTVLLAPAAASYDMFTGYPARGAAFVAAVLDEGRLDPGSGSAAAPVSAS
ncbi:UDP-N-acetylmuramoylalanine--D-glutamate ligase [Jatrophihabitans sp. GAS493]|uniref:UDP-N-acetylmuramoyl-L-alanine--D-glutamate ligase n=1 Tax=Jatrophihabitans sp. GAS493 TaxID=1907575 RepID=UPI000BB92424|nr:UDP-N-acetylmuramoylalanine--D-glutamate ligase [Jatrophihabitans sp. GAS493]